MSQDDPLNFTDCFTYEKLPRTVTLHDSWNFCVSGLEKNKNPEWKDLDDKQKQQNQNDLCCKEILQCKNPNDWLKHKKINVTCPSHNVYPHFGDIKSHKEKIRLTMSYGVL